MSNVSYLDERRKYRRPKPYVKDGLVHVTVTLTRPDDVAMVMSPCDASEFEHVPPVKLPPEGVVPEAKGHPGALRLREDAAVASRLGQLVSEGAKADCMIEETKRAAWLFLIFGIASAGVALTRPGPLEWERPTFIFLSGFGFGLAVALGIWVVILSTWKRRPRE